MLMPNYTVLSREELLKELLKRLQELSLSRRNLDGSPKCSWYVDIWEAVALDYVRLNKEISEKVKNGNF